MAPKRSTNQSEILQGLTRVESKLDSLKEDLDTFKVDCRREFQEVKAEVGGQGQDLNELALKVAKAETRLEALETSRARWAKGAVTAVVTAVLAIAAAAIGIRF